MKRCLGWIGLMSWLLGGGAEPLAAQTTLPPFVTSPCLTSPDEESLKRFIGDSRERAEQYPEDCKDFSPLRFQIQEAASCLPAGRIADATTTLSDGGGLRTITFTISSERVAPNLLGMMYQHARLELRRCQLPGEFLPRAVFDGTVISTVPAAGGPLRQDDELLVWAVGGNRVPNVVGKDYTTAIAELEAAQFEVGKRVAQKVEINKWQEYRRRNCGELRGTRGKIVSTSPTADTLVAFVASEEDERRKISITYESAPVWTLIQNMCNEEGIPY